MSKRPEITKGLSLALEHYLNPNNDTRIYMAKEVTFDYATGHAVRVDYMRFKPLNNTVSGIEKGDFYCYEIKSSVEDFHSKNGHNFIGDYNYYVMPAEVFEKVKNEIPGYIGVYTSSLKEHNGLLGLMLTRKARRRDRERSCSEMIFMMFRSYERDIVNDGKKIAKENIRQFIQKEKMNPAFLISRGIFSILNDPEHWTEEQIKELNDKFYLIPKEAIK